MLIDMVDIVEMAAMETEFDRQKKQLPEEELKCEKISTTYNKSATEEEDKIRLPQ